jgi:hypothetical protein
VQDAPPSLLERIIAQNGGFHQAGARAHALVRFSLDDDVTLIACTACQAIVSDRIGSLARPCVPKRSAWATKIWDRLARGEYRHVGLNTVLRVRASAPIAG